ncbi:MAG: hypothetical protein IH960_13990 [Chloroflexi bacterium]|nr:hypothetical protein [Chloroflexota bacterium]
MPDPARLEIFTIDPLAFSITSARDGVGVGTGGGVAVGDGVGDGVDVAAGS